MKNEIMGFFYRVVAEQEKSLLFIPVLVYEASIN